MGLTHREDPTMMRNGCLTLCQFNIPQDVLFDYERLVRILLHIVSEHTSEENNFIQREAEAEPKAAADPWYYGGYGYGGYGLRSYGLGYGYGGLYYGSKISLRPD